MNKQKVNQSQFLEDLTQCINNAPDFHSALSIILLQLCEATGWNYGEAWIPAQNGKVVELSPAWHVNTSSSSSLSTLEQFRHCSEAFVFPPDAGLPGRVWSSQQPEWLADAGAHSETYFLRNQIAKAFGVKAGFGVPMVANQQVLAVLVFFMLDRAQDEQLVELVTAAALQLAPYCQPLSAIPAATS